MTLENKWFLYILKENQVISDKDLSELSGKIDFDVPIDDLVKSIFNARISAFTTKEESEQLLGILNQAKDFALANSEDGHSVPEEINFPRENDKKEDKPQGNTSKNLNNQTANEIRNLLAKLRAEEASDLHIVSNAPTFIRKYLALERIVEKITPKEEVEAVVQSILTKEQIEHLTENKTITFALSFSNDERYRVTVITHKEGLSISFHIVSNKIKTLQELGFNKSNIDTIRFLLSHHNGMILITGPIGCGKTTTLASIVNELNKERNDHILMIENPVEIVQTSKSCNITQREISTHTTSYASAIKAALREDPDIIVVGELNDLETIEIAIKAAETGHLVIGTLQTSDAANTLNRLINTFPPFQQPQIKAMLSTSLRGIICQRLLPKINGGTILGTEFMVNNLAVANTIMEGKLYLLKSVMQTASKSGMTSMDACIYELFTHGKISKEVALLNVIDKKNYGKQIELGK